MQTNQGLTLDRYLEKRSPLEPAQAAKISIQVAQQLGSAAGSLLIHPGRILISKDGSVKLLPPAAEELSLPAVVEYPAYASPEEIRGGHPDVRSALYSLGCTLFELLSGEPPYSSSDPKQVLHAHVEGDVPDVRERASGVPDTLAEALRDLLAKDPELRIQTPEELVRRLKQGLAGAGAASHPASRPPSARAAVPTGAAGSGARTARPAAPAGSVPPRPAAPPPTPAAPSPRRMVTPGELKSGRTFAHSKAGAPGRKLLGAKGRRQGHRHADDEPRDEAAGPVVVKRRNYAFTIAGAVLGLLVGLLVVRTALERRVVGDAEAAARLEGDRKKALVTRKKAFQDDLAEQRKKVSEILARVKSRPADARQDMLLKAISDLGDNPYRYLLAEEIVKVWAAPAAMTPAEMAEEDKAFQKQKEEAEKLHAEGRLGKAYEKMMENEGAFKARHGKEIDDAVLKWSNELTAKWDADKAEADRLAKDGEVEQAVKILEQARDVFGDGPIIRESERILQAIQEIATLQEGSKNRPAKKSLEEEVEDAGQKTPEEGMEKKEAPGEKGATNKDAKGASEDAGADSDFDDPDAK